MHIPTQQGTEPACKDSQSLTEVVGSCKVMRNDASCNEVIQSKGVTSLGLVISLISWLKSLDSETMRANSVQFQNQLNISQIEAILRILKEGV